MKTLYFITGLVFVLTAGFAQSSDGHLNLENDVAISGYDPVAYFLQGKATKGKKEFSVREGRAVYYFSSLTNKDLFVKSSTLYKPQYGGWCAYAMGDSGEKVPVDPETFKVLNGKLYLFYNRFFNNTLTKWNADEQNLLSKAERNWKKITTSN